MSTSRRIEEYTKAQAHCSLPLVRDIQEIRFTRQQLVTIQRTYAGGTITPSTTIPQAGALSFALSSLPDYTEFTALFDQYRIIQASVSFEPTSLVSTSTPLITVLDYDDAVVPTSLNMLYEYETMQSSTSGTMQKRVLTPKLALAAYSGVFTSFGVAPTGTWIDSASPSVLYYGVKWYNDAQTGNNTSINWDIIVSLTCQFKLAR